MVELAIGSKFWYGNKFCEVVEAETDFICGRCVFNTDVRKCRKAKCYSVDRHDEKSAYFREVKE